MSIRHDLDNKEFDPGSEQMLAAGLTHASRANNHNRLLAANG